MRITTLCMAAALLLSAGPAAAIGNHEFGFELGTSLPSGDFSDGANIGYNVGAVYQFNIDRFGVGAEVKYNAWSASDDMNAAAEAAYGAGSKFSFSAMQYDVYGTFNIPMSAPLMRPYVKGGLGAYSPSNKLEAPTGDIAESSTEFGVMAGLGMDYTFTPKVKFGMDVAYHRVKNSPDDFYSVGVRVMMPFKTNSGD